MSNLYETLGVGKGVSEADLKHRALARKWQPRPGRRPCGLAKRPGAFSRRLTIKNSLEDKAHGTERQQVVAHLKALSPGHVWIF